MLNLLAGALAGFLSWALVDLTPWFRSITSNTQVFAVGSALYWLQTLIGGLFGLLVGALLGVIDALAFDSDEQRLRAVGLGALIGAAGGIVGIILGQILWSFLAPANAGTLQIYAHPAAWVQEVIARSLGWALIGAGIGAAQGASRWSTRILTQGLFGGAVGGLIGGFAFEALQRMIGQPMFSRLIGFVLIGAAIGFFIGLIQNIFKQAWIKVVVGRNEGKEYLIAKPVTTIGRSELADIGLFGDKAIAPTHCAIEMSGGQYRLRPVAALEPAPTGQSFAPTVVNGRDATEEVWLADGDTILIASRTLQFRVKVTSTAAPQPVQPPEQTVPSPRRRIEQMPPEPSMAFQKNPTPRPPDEPLRPVPSAAYTQSSRPPLTANEAGAVGRPTAAAQSDLAGTKLVGLEGPYNGQSFDLRNRPMTMGRAADRDIPLTADNGLSRHHVTIGYEGGRHTIQDEGSANGTFLNEVKLPPRQARALRIGDYIRIGHTIMRYE
jgi:pSer/pThr/pTyr-binding forkhead associated (FHA) protein